MTAAHPIIPWIGGKRRLLPELLPLIDDGHTCYVEPFAGAAAVFWAKRPSSVEVLNDINGDVVNLYRVVQHHLEEFARQFKWALSARQTWLWEQAKPAETLTDIQRAARFYHLQRQAFGGKVDGQSWGFSTTAPPKFNFMRIEEDLSAAHLRLAGVYVEHGHWLDIVQRYDRPHTLHYCDPPYWQTEGYGVPFEWHEYERLLQFAQEAKGRVIISINDHPDIRRLFAGMPMRQVNITYTVGGGSAGDERAELIIGNWADGWPKPRVEQLGLAIPD